MPGNFRSFHPKPFVLQNVWEGSEWKDYFKEGKKRYEEAQKLNKRNDEKKLKIVTEEAIAAFTHSLRILPVHEHVDEVYRYLIECFTLLNNPIAVAEYKKYLAEYTPGSKLSDA